MEIFKLFEATMANVQPGNFKDLRRDQLLDNYDAAAQTLKTLIRAKEGEITYRRDLIEMLDKAKTVYDNKLLQAKQDYQEAKKSAPASLDLRANTKKPDPSKMRSTTPPMPPPPSRSGLQQQLPQPPHAPPAQTNNSSPTFVNPPIDNNNSASGAQMAQHTQQSLPLGPPQFTSPEAPIHGDNHENRSSLDRRLSEFLKTFPNLTQAGLAPPSTSDAPKPLPGYYTPQPPPIPAAPSLMEMMKYPPPNMVPPSHHGPSHHENHDPADMDLSDHDEPNGGTNPKVLPMIANAMQQGAGGRTQSPAHPYVPGQQFNSPVQYAPRINPLAFDPSIMDPNLRNSSPSSGRDKHSDKGSNRYSSGSSSLRHGSSKSRYSSSSSSTSSHSSSRSKRR